MAAGNLDSTFGSGGEIVINGGSIFSGGVEPVDTIVQTDGKTITIGSGFSFTAPAGYYTQLKRYNTDGTIDSTFGTGGKTDTRAGYFQAKLQSDGKLILLSRVSASDVTSNIVLTRFNTNGTIDNTFGTSGSLTTDVAGYGFIDERNGKILLGAGGTSTTTFNIVKVNLYNSDGTIDNTFGTNGTISTATSNSLASGGIVQTDGKVLLSVGSVGGFGAIKRYNRDGSVDNNFGYDGVLLGAPASLSQQSDGRILANDGARVIRYNLDGSRDYTFGTLGKSNSYSKIVLEGDGKIVTAGSKSGIAGNQQDFFLSRYSNDGVLDLTFGTDGTASVDFAKGSDVLSNLTLGTDGRIFASGKTTPSGASSASFASASLLNDLSATTNRAPVVANKLTSKTIVLGATTFNLNIPANTFSDPDAGDTLTYTAIAKRSDVVFASAPLPFNTATSTFSFTPGAYVGPVDIQVTATDKGGLSAISNFKLTVASSNATAGNLDPTFGIDGSYGVSVDRLGGLINTTGAIVQADGKVVVNRADGTNGIQLTRYNTDGSRDLTFKNSSIANAVNSGFSGMIQQSDGKILVRGLKGDINSLTDYNNYALSRFNSDGSVDNTFGTNGSIATNLNQQSYFGTFSESNGKIYLAAGVKQSGSVQSPLQLNRYNSDGSVDSTFGTSGAVILDSTATSSKSVASIQQQADGKALVAVNVGGSSGADYLIRYNSNGNIDSTFGTNGRVTIITASGVRPNQILQQSDGKILVTQGTNLKRYNLDGSIDPTFATGGVISFSGSSVNNTPSLFIRKVIQESDGKLILDITRSTTDPNRLLRYNLDGSIDNTFVGDFVGETVFNITQTSDGKIVVVGTTPATDLTGSGSVNYTENFVATRYNTSPVALPGANCAPVVATALAPTAASPGRAFTYTVPNNTFSDPDLGDTLTYTATQPGNNPLPSWLTFNPTTRTFGGTPIDANVGPLSVQVIATDKGGLSVNSDFDIPVGLAIVPTPIPGNDRSVYDIQPGTQSSNPIVNPDFKPLNPTSLSKIIDGTLYFTADYVGGRELWKIDTTNSNSKVLLVDVNNNGSKSSSPDNLTTIGGKLYFAASDETGGRELWKLDKTPEYSKVQLLKIDPLVSSDAANLTNINGKLFFTAKDALNGNEVWMLDTTISNSKPQLFDINIGNRTGSNPADLTNVNGKLYFTADDGFRGKELWRIDPTIANSKPQLFNLNRTGNVTSDGGSNPTNLTDINGTLYFSADDLINGRELWKLDPTSSAPTLIDVIPGANSSNPVGMTDVNGTIYFQAFDSTNGAELWSFDPKTPGSSPKIVQDLYPGSTGSTPIDLKNVNGTLYFSAFDVTSISQRRWTLDTTKPNSKPQVLTVGAFDPSIIKNQIDVDGTRYFTDSTSAYGTELFTAPVNSTASSDFNGDRKSDILWRNDYGSVVLWQMDGATVTNGALTSVKSVDSSWKIAGITDFNGDKKADILWRNDDGGVALWQMDGSTVTSSKLASTPSLDNSWKTAGTGDFNGDGKADILWRNTSGAVVVWQMDGSTVTSSKLASTPSLDNSWKTAGTGDFNGDGKSDILWRNDDGSVALWQMDGSNIASSSLTSTPKLDNSWKINGTGDFNADGKADILWSNTNSGATAIWQMDGARVVDSSRTSSPLPDPSWTLNGIGDFNGDGKSDILWRNINNTMDIWQMNGAQVVSSTLTSAPADSSHWKVAGVAI
jgi:uncharacterized delta-60 repeat protein